MFSKAHLLVLCMLAALSGSAQCLIDNFDNCATQPDNYVSNSVVGSNSWQTVDLTGLGDFCAMAYQGNGNQAITEALFNPIDLTGPAWGFNPGETAQGQFHLLYSGDIAPSGGVLKLVVFNPAPQELCAIPLDNPADFDVVFNLPAVEVLNNPFGFVIEDLSGLVQGLEVDDIVMFCPIDPPGPCAAVLAGVTAQQLEAPAATQPCTEYKSTALRYFNIATESWEWCDMPGFEIPENAEECSIVVLPLENDAAPAELFHFYGPKNCDDGDPCTVDYCDPATGECVHEWAWTFATVPPASPGACYEYLGYEVSMNNQYFPEYSTIPADYPANPNPAALEFAESGTTVEDFVVICDWVVSHIFVPINCDDGNPCTDDYCEDGVCKHTAPWDDLLAQPASPNPCYTYIGVEVVANFVYQEGVSTVPLAYILNPSPEEITAIEAESTVVDGVLVCDWVVTHTWAPMNCDDGDPCTVDTCEDGVCLHTPLWEDALSSPPASADPCDVYLGSIVTVGGNIVFQDSGLDDATDVQTDLGDDVDCLWQIDHYYGPKNCDDDDPCTIDTCDGNGNCVHTPILIGVTASTSAAKCPAYNNGSIEAFGSGGTGVYVITVQQVTILGLGVEQFPNLAGLFTGLVPGWYVITVYDSNGCVGQKYVEVKAHSGMELYDTPVRPTCWNDTNGSITVGVEHGTQPYTTTFQKQNADGSYGPSSAPNSITVNAGVTNFNYTNLGRGIYKFTVTDADGCEAERIIQLIPLNSLLTLNASATSQTCPGACAGQIDLAIAGGAVNDYLYTLDGGSTWVDLAAGVNMLQVGGLCAGNYVVQAKNAAGCKSNVVNLTITKPADWNTAVAVLDNMCYGLEEGEVAVEFSGATPPYTTTNSGATLPAPMSPAVLLGGGGLVGSFNLVELGAGAGNLVITDSRGCTKNESWTVVEPPALLADTMGTLPALTGNDGAIDAIVFGGTPDFSYLWYHNDEVIAVTQDITGLEPGWYGLWVTDDNGCRDSLSVDLEGIASLLDSDGDDLTDWQENNETGTDPFDADSDDDLLTDGEELELGTDPNNHNTDGDASNDGAEVLFMLTDPLVADVVAAPLLGCTYPEALNYDPTAGIDNGSCLLEDADPSSCASDVDGDGEVGTPDLLAVLGSFGATCQP